MAHKKHFHLTAFGKVVYDAEEIVRKAAENLWKLREVDSIDFEDGVTTSDRKKILKSVLDDLEIGLILTNLSTITKRLE